MKKDIQIDDLMKGINDDELILQEQTLHTEGTVNEPHEEGSRTDLLEPATESLQPEEKDNCWKDFMTYLENDESNPDKTERLVCKLDRDLADSLDDCNIRNRCRSDLVNAIVRAFFKNYLPELAQYRRKKKSLFIHYNQSAYEKESMD